MEEEGSEVWEVVERRREGVMETNPKKKQKRLSDGEEDEGEGGRRGKTQTKGVRKDRYRKGESREERI